MNGVRRSPTFATTRWTLILKAGDDRHPDAAAALEQLCHEYWFPLYAYIRRRGHDDSHAQDLTQGFFEMLLSRKDLAGLVRGEGRFRSFLLTALNHYLANQHAHATAQKRGAHLPHVPLDADPLEARLGEEPAHHQTPERTYERQWALALLEGALSDLESHHAHTGKGEWFAALKPYLSRQPGPGDYEALGRQLDLAPGTVAVQVHRLRQQYRIRVRDAVARTVVHASEVDEEMRHLLAVLSRTHDSP